MATRDYILCAKCNCKLIYDGNDAIRNGFEYRWGDPKASDWTVMPWLVCLDCDGKREAAIEIEKEILSDYAVFDEALIKAERKAQ